MKATNYEMEVLKDFGTINDKQLTISKATAIMEDGTKKEYGAKLYLKGKWKAELSLTKADFVELKKAFSKISEKDFDITPQKPSKGTKKASKKTE